MKLRERNYRIAAGIGHLMHNLLFDMARSGIAVIAISSELPEVLAISDRIVTMREGRVTGEIARDRADQETLMSMMTLAKAA